MARQAVDGEVVGKAFPGPAGQGIDLEAARAIGLEKRQGPPGARLVALAARDPGIKAPEGALERRAFAQCAAGVGSSFVEQSICVLSSLLGLYFLNYNLLIVNS